MLVAAGGLGFHNGGTAAGASQRHKHVQWIPRAEGNANLRLFAAGLSGSVVEQDVAVHPALIPCAVSQCPAGIFDVTPVVSYLYCHSFE